MSRLSTKQQKNLAEFFNSLWQIVKEYGITEDDDNTEYWNAAVQAASDIGNHYYHTIPESDEYILINNLLMGFLRGLEKQQERKREK
jgi:hypothetical protein